MPRLHHFHHIPATGRQNFGTILTIWDRLFGRFTGLVPPGRAGAPGRIFACEAAAEANGPGAGPHA